jgi:hypothetical protein
MRAEQRQVGLDNDAFIAAAPLDAQAVARVDPAKLV